MYGDRGNRGFGPTAPVNVGEELDVKIEAVGEKGDGIAKKNGFVLFVPGTKEGDEVRVRVTKVLRKVGFAEVIGQASGPVEASPSGGKPKPKREESAEESGSFEQSSEESSFEDSEDFGSEN